MILLHKPEMSFEATLHLQLRDGQPELHGLSATYIELAPTGLDNGWIYASEGNSYAGKKRIAFGLDEVTGRLVALQFWFACFYWEQDDQYGYRYSLHVTDPGEGPGQPFAGYELDVSRNGYAGVYSRHPLEEELQGESMPLWRLESFDPYAAKPGHSFGDLVLISPRGQRARRFVEDGFPYLSDSQGTEIMFTLKIARIPAVRPW